MEYIRLAFFLGGFLGYGIFFLRYKQRSVIDELRSNLKHANKEITVLQDDLEEYTQQNIVLKEKVTELLEKNDDLSSIISELSRYYYHIKKASEKTSELTKFLQHPDEDLEEKLDYYSQAHHKNNHKHGDKKFF